MIEWLAIALLYAVGTVGLLGQIAGALGIPLTLPLYGVLLFAALAVIAFETRPKREPQTPLAWAATILTVIPIAVLVPEHVHDAADRLRRPRDMDAEGEGDRARALDHRPVLPRPDVAERAQPVSAADADRRRGHLRSYGKR